MNLSVERMVSDALLTEMTPYLSERGFHRDGNTIRYERKITSGVQRLEFQYEIRPRYKADALVHMLPQFVLVFPEINETFANLVSTTPHLAAAAAEVTFYDQFGNVAPKDERREAGHWYMSSPEDSRQCIGRVREFVRKWVMPFLDEYVDIPTLIRGCEANDSRLPHDRRFMLMICAAYISVGRPGEALKHLESHFGKPKSRREYAEVFNYIQQRQNPVA